MVIIALVLGCLLIGVAAVPAYAEEVITVYNGAGTGSDTHYVDIDFYPIEKGKALSWFNEDSVEHRLAIFAPNGAIIAESGPIAVRGSFTYSFQEEGIYTFTAAGHPEVSGTVLVTDDIVTTTADYLASGVNVEVSWTPATPSIGDTAYVKTVFMNKDIGKNLEHVDHVLSIIDSDGRRSFRSLTRT